MDLTTKVWLANEIRVWGLAATTFIGLISFFATWTHSRWQAELSAENARISEDRQRESSEKIAGLNLRAVGLEKETAQLGKDTALANAQAEQARLDLAKFRAPRELKPEQQAILIEELKGNIFEINVVSQVDPESREYRFQFVQTIRKAGIKVNTGSLSPMDSVTGLHERVSFWSKDWRGTDGFPNPENVLYRALLRAGLYGGAGAQPNFFPDGSKEVIVSEIPTIFIWQKTPW